MFIDMFTVMFTNMSENMLEHYYVYGHAREHNTDSEPTITLDLVLMFAHLEGDVRST